jgi:cytochrome c556
MGVSSGKALAAALALSVAAAAGAAMALDAKGAAAARHENFKQLGGAFKGLNDELKKGQPNKAAVAADARKVKGLADALPSWFPKGSGPETGVHTHAKAQVWSDPAGFAAAAQRLQAETGKLQQFAAAGDLAAVKSQVAAVGGACKNCHDKYRQPEKK